MILTIKSIERHVNYQASINDGLIPEQLKSLKIIIGQYENFIDLSTFYFRLIPPMDIDGMYYAGYREAQLNYVIKVQDFSKNDQILLYWNEKTYLIDLNQKIITLETSILKFVFFYEIYLTNNDQIIGQNTEEMVESKAKNYTSMKFETQKIHSFFSKERSEKLPKVDF